MDGIDPHSVFDSDDDGDLDLRDLALFQQFPPLIHSIARPQAAVVQNECCLGESGLRNLGNCMSGPGQTDVPHTCQSAVECEVGFDQPVEGGDYAYQLCDVDGTIMPDASAMCVSWSAAQMPLVDACPASHVPGITAFITFDADGDGDFDLTDYADFQRAVQGD
jgi:hypothetical protein